MTGLIVAKQWQPIVIRTVIPIVTTIAIVAPIVILIVNPIVVPCLGHQAWTPLCFNNLDCNISATMA
jgi:hypothetical protein